jgi:transcriptional regulator with XRE-family HTH domain
MSISPSQCRAARGLLKWTQPKLADVSGIGLSTINRYENETRPPRAEAVQKLQAALERAGVEFMFEDKNGGVGVRMRKN